jgi:hypothetical protein
MNTVIKFTDPVKTTVTKNDKILHRGVAWIVSPNSLHTEGEILLYMANTLFFRLKGPQERDPDKLIEFYREGGKTIFIPDGPGGPIWIESDLVIPRGQLTEFTDLARQGFDRIFWIRNPALGLGSLSLEIGRGNEPIRVQRTEALEKPRVRKTNK